MGKHIERKRKDDFDLKQQQVAEQRSRLRMAAEQEQELARKQQKLLERKREMVLEEARYEEEMRKEELLSRQEAMEENLARIQAGQERERKQTSIHAKIQKDNIVAAMEQVKITKKWSKASKQMNMAMTSSSSTSSLKKSKKKRLGNGPTMNDSGSLPDLGGGSSMGGGSYGTGGDQSANPESY